MSSSTRKPPLTELRQPILSNRKPTRSLPNTPTRYAPSTPHALRALEQRSAGRARTIGRSASKRKHEVSRGKDEDVVRPDSARGILRRLAKITAKDTKRASEVLREIGKENVRPRGLDEEDEDEPLKKPRLTLDVDGDDSLDLEASGLPAVYEDDDSELLAAPTPSILPDEADDTGFHAGGEERSMSFKSIDFAKAAERQSRSEKADRLKSRLSFAPSALGGPDDEDDDEDPTMLTERGRRAVSEDMTGRFSRYSFGSIRMSDFGPELEVRRESEFGKDRKTFDASAPDNALLEGETMDLESLRGQMNEEDDGREEFGPLVGDEDHDFQLFVQEEDREIAGLRRNESALQPRAESDALEDEAEAAGQRLLDQEQEASPSPQRTRRLTDLETATVQSANTKRRKRLKMTRHGTLVPSLPSSLIKRIATETAVLNGRRRPKLGRDHMKALEQATEWFFEQAGEDLAAYADHARRTKRVDASDAMMLMRRQRVLKGDGELKTLAKEFLPDAALDELELPEDL